uniref:Serine-threonine/tyrosine-protein kinase catalytic domain-containing protein n=1 Tax=Kalanchoe fedtschenkoi TaxID=63787 RepID=A0A7N0RFZ5_KALFE
MFVNILSLYLYCFFVKSEESTSWGSWKCRADPVRPRRGWTTGTQLFEHPAKSCDSEDCGERWSWGLREVGMPTESGSEPRRGETVIVAMAIDESRDKRGNLEALSWALKHVVRPRDTVLALGILREFGKPKCCLPCHIGIAFSSIWEKLELNPHSEMTASEMEEELESKSEEYRRWLQPFYSHCRKREVNLEVKIVAGFKPRDITAEEALSFNTRWIVLDIRLKKEMQFLCGRVRCDIAVMKGRGVATLILPKHGMNLPPPRASLCPKQRQRQRDDVRISPPMPDNPSALSSSPSWYPLSWRSGCPRVFSISEIEAITDSFSDTNLVRDDLGIKVYIGSFEETPVLVKCVPVPSSDDEAFQPRLAALSRLRHRNIMNLVGYCCTDTEACLLSVYPSFFTLELILTCDEGARNLPWGTRWDIALDISSCLRYLHEECGEGPDVHLPVSSANVYFYHDWSPMLGNSITANWLDGEYAASDTQPVELSNPVSNRGVAADISDYGVFLLELVSGKSADGFRIQHQEQSLEEWALPFLASGSVSDLVDCRLEGAADPRTVNLMARAAQLCLKNGLEQGVSMNEVMAVLRRRECSTSNSEAHGYK